MPKIISAFTGTDPLGSKLAELGASMFGGNTTDNALKNEQLYALQRQNTETDNYAKLVAEGGIMPTANNKLAQAMILAAGLDPQKSAILGRMDAATSFGADDPRTANWQIAAGDPYSSTAGAFNKTLAEQTRNNDLQSGDRRYGVDQDVVLKKFLNSNISAADAQASRDRQYDTNMDFGAKNYATDQTLNASKYNTDVDANTDRFKHSTLSAADEAINNWRKYNTDQTQQTERTKMTEAFDPVTSQPVFRPANDLSAVQPFMSEADTKGALLRQHFDNLAGADPYQREVLGANVDGAKTSSPKNYIVNGQTFVTYDGITSAVDGTPLPPGGYIGTVQGSATDTGVTKAVATDLQSDTIANKKFDFLVNKGLALTANPQLFGPQGYVRSTLQEIAQGLKGVSTIIDPDPNKAAAEVQNARQEAAQYGVNIPELYDPQLQEVETIWGLLVYQGASALAGQENRSVSDKDVQAMRQILGSPQSLFSSAESMKAKLNQARDVVANYDKISREALQEQAPVTSPFGSTQPDTNAQPLQIKGVDDYNALPPGAKYIDPTGVPRVKGQR